MKPNNLVGTATNVICTCWKFWTYEEYARKLFTQIIKQLHVELLDFRQYCRAVTYTNSTSLTLDYKRFMLELSGNLLKYCRTFTRTLYLGNTAVTLVRMQRKLILGTIWELTFTRDAREVENDGVIHRTRGRRQARIILYYILYLGYIVKAQ